MKAYLRGNILFTTENTRSGIRVLERQPEFSTEDATEYLADDQQWGKHKRALYGEQKDLPLFAKISLACILANSSDIIPVLGGDITSTIGDAEVISPLPGVTSERFRIVVDNLPCVVFLLEIDGELSHENLTGIIIRLHQININAAGYQVHGVCIVNHQQHLAPALRNSYLTLGDDLTHILATCRISLFFASDVARYINCSREKNWPLTPLREGLKSSGFTSCSPPDSVFAGRVLRAFPRLNVLGVDVDCNPHLSPGDKIFVRSASGYESMTIESIEANKSSIDKIKKGIGTFKVIGSLKHIAEGAFVFRSNISSSTQETVAPSIAP